MSMPSSTVRPAPRASTTRRRAATHRPFARALTVAATLLAAGAAFAQGTAPPNPPGTPSAESAPAEAPAQAAQMTEMKSKLESMYEDFRTLKTRLPFDLAAGVYLFYYQPIDKSAVLSGDSLDGSFQVYAFYLKLDKEFQGFGGHAELRMRDGGHVGAGSNNAWLRGFFTSNIWFQEVYAYYTPGPYLKVKAGKVYRQVGLFWDDSFFGNIQYFDGLKLNPDYGLSAEGHLAFAQDRVDLAYSAQFFLNSDGISGALDYARTYGMPTPGVGFANAQALRWYTPAPEAQLDSAGNRVGALRNIVDGRVVLTLRPTKALSIAAGFSALTATVHRASSVDRYVDDGSMSHIAGDLQLTLAPPLHRDVEGTAYVEYLHQLGEGVRTADYLLAGVRARFKTVSARVNVSWVDYQLAGTSVEELIVQPGVTWAIGGGLAALLEIDSWWRRAPGGPAGPSSFGAYDNSLNLVFAYSY